LLLILFALTLPLWRFLPAVLAGLLFVEWLCSGDWKNKKSRLAAFSALLFPCLLYLLYVAGMLYTSDTGTGGRDLETKLSLFILPLVMVSSEMVSAETLKKVLHAFVAGCGIAMLLCTGHSIYDYYDEIAQVRAGLVHDTYISTEFFFASRLSWFVHPSYCAMYVTFAMAWVFVCATARETDLFFVLLLALNLAFTVFILFLASKLGMVTAMLCWLVFIIAFIRKRKWYLYGTVFFVLLMGGVFLLATRSQIIASRFAYAWQAINAPVDITSSESSTVRLLIWKAGREVIGEHVLAGVGTGDLHAALDEKYTKYGMTGALEHHLNAHSQYLQTFITIGLPGILVLLWMLVRPLARAWRWGAWMFFFFILLFMINILVESMLELEAGVLFFSFFYSLLGSRMFGQQR
jgi:O-antigen ligase